MKKTYWLFILTVSLLCVNFCSCGGKNNAQTNESASIIEVPKTDELPKWLLGHWGIKKPMGFSVEYVVEIKFKSNNQLDFYSVGQSAQTCSFSIPKGSNCIIFDYHGQTIKLYYDNSRRKLKTSKGDFFYRD